VGRKTIKEIPSAVFSGVFARLEEVTAMLEPYLIHQAEGQPGELIGEDSMEFLEKVHELAVEHTKLFPGMIVKPLDGAEFSEIRDLKNLETRLDLLSTSVRDTELIIGGNVLENAMVFYNTVKIAAKRDVPGISVIYEELKPRFPCKKQKRKKTGWAAVRAG